MELLLGKVLVLGLALLAVKLYWDKRQVENALYISEHVFFKADAVETDPQHLKGRAVKRARKAVA